MKKKRWFVLGYGVGVLLSVLLWRWNPTLGGILLAGGLVYMLVGL